MLSHSLMCSAKLLCFEKRAANERRMQVISLFILQRARAALGNLHVIIGGAAISHTTAH